MKVICISGKAQHGKDTVAGYILEELTSKSKSVIITHYGDLLKYICKTFFKWDGKKNKYGRYLLQYVGTDIIRKQKSNYWVNFVAEILYMLPNENKWNYVIIPDCRFHNEIEVLKDYGFDVTHIRVIREEFESPLTLEQQNHPSETELDDVIPDITVYNSGTLKDLQEEVSNVMEFIVRNDVKN